ncbi:MAG: trehalose-phosphatase [Anaerolineae bacterium]
MIPPADDVLPRLAAAASLRLFLDYDGTLADFAPTPDHVEPDPDLVALLRRLAAVPSLRVAILSGRRLSHVQKLVPVPGILLAGTYGLELRTPAHDGPGERFDRLDYEAIRPVLETIKPRWAELMAAGGDEARPGFYLEDKGWSLAIHARFADPDETEEVLARARRFATETIEAHDGELFRLLGGHKFLEIGPRLAHKGRTIDYLLDLPPDHPAGYLAAWPGAPLLYVGDDDKDEEAFEVIQARGGTAIVVMSRPRETRADYRLESPADTRRWLRALWRYLL